MKPKLRWRVLERDDHTCQYCGRSAPEVRLEVDHVVARSRGGSDTLDNLVAACWECNQGKRARDGSQSFARRSVYVGLRMDAESLAGWVHDLMAERHELEERVDALEEEIRYLRYQREWQDEDPHQMMPISDVMRGMAS